MKSLYQALHNLRNPLARFKTRFSRYAIIIFCMGTLSFILALVLLYLRMGPLLSLVLSACASGLLTYTTMELWVVPHRKGEFSWYRLAGNALIGVCVLGGRYLVLVLALRHITLPFPFEMAGPLALAYLASFAIGYALRCLFVFRKE